MIEQQRQTNDEVPPQERHLLGHLRWVNETRQVDNTDKWINCKMVIFDTAKYQFLDPEQETPPNSFARVYCDQYGWCWTENCLPQY